MLRREPDQAKWGQYLVSFNATTQEPERVAWLRTYPEAHARWEQPDGYKMWHITHDGYWVEVDPR